MAQRFWEQFSFGLEKAPVSLYGLITGAGASNTALTIARGKGFASATSSSGLGSQSAVVGCVYTINLQDKYFALLSTNFTIVSKDGTTQPAVVAGYLMSYTLQPAGNAGTQLVVQFASATGTALAPALNEQVFVEVILSNSSAL